MRFLFPLLLGTALLLSAVARATDPAAGADVLSEYFPSYNGVIVSQIQVHGLKRSREAIVRWMLGAREGEPFDAQAWQTGIEHLYKTESLYGIHSVLTPHNGKLWIDLYLEDKWTLFPYVDFQGGGGALAISAGVFDSNLLGTFTNAYLGGGYLNHEYSYELGFSQKWFLQSSYSLSFELSDKDAPVAFESVDGTPLQTFTWARTRRAINIGKQNGEDVFWNVGIESFRDRMRDANPRTSTFIFRDKSQYRIAPSLKLWKVAHSDYLEQGHELTLGISEANPLNPGLEYHAATVAWKQVFFAPDTRNIAYFLTFGHMSAAPAAYQFRLGGFDSVRGFAMNRILGLDIGRANLEYRSTLLTWKIPLFDIDRMVLQSCVFTDGGASWNSAGIDLVSGKNTQTGTRLLYSAGVGLRAIFLHFADATARIDLAKAIYPSEGYNVAFGIGQFF